MNLIHIDIIKLHFERYNTDKYFHKEENFHISINDNNIVYQLNSDHEEQGIELETFEDFKIRFKSFAGEEFDSYLV